MTCIWAYAIQVSVILLPILKFARSMPLDVKPRFLRKGHQSHLRFYGAGLIPEEEEKYQVLLRMVEEIEAGTAARIFTCTVPADVDAVDCSVNLPFVGSAVALLVKGGIEMSSTMIHVYEQPDITEVSPTSLPIEGGQILSVVLAGTPLQTYGSIAARFNVDGMIVEFPLEVSSDGLRLSGRSSMTPFSPNTNAELLVSLNGQDFVSTGLFVNFVSKPKLKIGFILVGDPTDIGWNYQHNVARLYLEKAFLGQVETVQVEHVSEWGPNMCDFCAEEPGWNASKKLGMWNDEPSDYFGTHESATVMRRLIEEEGCGVIITTSFYYHWDAYHMANRYPDKYFVHVSSWLTRRNMAEVFPKIYQARYLSGIAMGWYIKKHNKRKLVGYVSAYKLGETVRAINAFKLGLEKVDPEIEIALTWLNTWHDSRKEGLGVERLITFYDVEGIAQHTDSRAPQIKARDLGKVGVGYNTDMLLTVGDSVLTSPVLVWGPLYEKMVQQVLDDPVNADLNQNLWYGAEFGAWRLSELSSKVPPEAVRMIEEETTKLKNGQDEIFCRPKLRDYKGRIRNDPLAANPAVNPVPWEADHLVPGTTCLTDPVVNQHCQEYDASFNCREFWLLEGVLETCAPTPTKPEGVTAINQSDSHDVACFLGTMDVPDRCAPGEELTLLGCQKCVPGKYVPPESLGGDEVCLECQQGYFASKAGMTACEPCSPGTFAPSAGSLSCTLCAPGSYTEEPGQPLCFPCRPGHAAPVNGSDECSACNQGSYAAQRGLTECTPCADGRTTMRLGSVSPKECLCEERSYSREVGGACEPCRQGMRCPFGSDLNNYFNKMALSDAREERINKDNSSNTSEKLATIDATRNSSSTDSNLELDAILARLPATYPMLEPLYWSSEDDPTNVFRCSSTLACPGGDPGSCGPRRTAIACAECEDQTMRLDGSCEPCDGGAWRVTTVMVFSPFIAALAYNRFNFPMDRAVLPKRAAMNLVFVLILYVQSLAVFNRYDVKYGDLSTGISTATDFTILDLEFLHLGCGGLELGEYKAKYILTVLLPVVVLIVFSFDYAVGLCAAHLHHKWGAAPPSASLPIRTMSFLLGLAPFEFAKMHNVFFSMLNTFYTGVTNLAGSLWQCYEHPNKSESMLAAPHIICYDSDEWKGILPFAVLAMIIYTIGLFVGFGYVNWVAPRRFHEVRFKKKWLFLLEKFHPNVWWWDQLILLKGLGINVSSMLFLSGISQIYWALCVLVVYTSLLFAFLPWRHHLVNALDCLVSCTLIGTLALGAWFADSTQWRKELTDWFQLWFTMGVFLPVLAWAGLMMLFIRGRSLGFKRDVESRLLLSEEIRLTFMTMLSKSFVDWNKCILRLGDHDLQTLQRANDVLVSELFHLQPSRHVVRQRLILGSRDFQVCGHEDRPELLTNQLKVAAQEGHAGSAYARHLLKAKRSPSKSTEIALQSLHGMPDECLSVDQFKDLCGHLLTDSQGIFSVASQGRRSFVPAQHLRAVISALAAEESVYVLEHGGTEVGKATEEKPAAVAQPAGATYEDVDGRVWLVPEPKQSNHDGDSMPRSENSEKLGVLMSSEPKPAAVAQPAKTDGVLMATQPNGPDTLVAEFMERLDQERQRSSCSIEQRAHAADTLVAEFMERLDQDRQRSSCRIEALSDTANNSNGKPPGNAVSKGASPLTLETVTFKDHNGAPSSSAEALVVSPRLLNSPNVKMLEKTTKRISDDVSLAHEILGRLEEGACQAVPNSITKQASLPDRGANLQKLQKMQEDLARGHSDLEAMIEARRRQRMASANAS